MRKLVLFMHVTLDGFVAGPSGEMDWINVDDEIFDYAGQRTNESDTALYGRVTYQMMESYWPTAGQQPNASKHDIEHSTWYNKVTKVVMSKSLEGKKIPNTKVISENLEREIADLKRKNGKDILMFGSPSAAHSLMESDLIDDYWIFINPVLLGSGIPIFSDLKERQKLKLSGHHVFPSGVISAHYQRTR